MNNYKFSQRSLDRMKGVDERLVKCARLALLISDYDFGIPEHGGVRTAEEQNALYQAGKSKCDGYTKKSKHQDGLALDVYAYVNNRASWEIQYLKEIADAMLAAAEVLGVDLEWGGNWKYFVDAGHFEIKG